MAKKNVADRESKPEATTDKAKPANNESSQPVVEFFQDTKNELDKVIWPSRQQLLSESAAVILMVILVATIIYLVDNLFVWLAGKLF